MNRNAISNELHVCMDWQFIYRFIFQYSFLYTNIYIFALNLGESFAEYDR